MPARYAHVRSGKISDSKHKSAVDHHAQLTAYVPGPGAHDTAANSRDFYALPEGGRLNLQPPKDGTKHFEEYPMPGPGDHGIPNDPNKPIAKNARFSRDPRHTEFIRQAVLQTRGNPGPGGHDVLEANENRSAKPFCPEGGRFSAAPKPASYFDQAAKLQEGKPSADTYNLPGGVNGDKASGKLVWRYESATMQETKRLVTLACGARNEAPGPGTYDVPDPPPLAQAPVLKGREFGHGMPAPFAYNCKPDLSRKFSTPVRQQNSGASIYGTGPRQRARSTGSRPGSADGGNPHVHPSELPPADDASDVDYADQWSPGGFADLRKSKSTGALRRKVVPEHPVIAHTRTFYKALSKKNGRKPEHKAFLPGTAKRNNGHEPVATHDASKEYQRICQHKQTMAAVAGGILSATNYALEPLDEEKLRKQAVQGLMEKAKERMRFEGVAEENQEMILAELPRVLEAHKNRSMYLPEFMQGKRVIVETKDPGFYRVDNSELKASSSKLAYRKSMKSDDVHEEKGEPWGAIVEGVLHLGYLEVSNAR